MLPDDSIFVEQVLFLWQQIFQSYVLQQLRTCFLNLWDETHPYIGSSLGMQSPEIFDLSLLWKGCEFPFRWCQELEKYEIGKLCREKFDLPNHHVRKEWHHGFRRRSRPIHGVLTKEFTSCDLVFFGSCSFSFVANFSIANSFSIRSPLGELYWVVWSCAGFAWWSGRRALCAARSAWEGRRGRGWWRTHWSGEVNSRRDAHVHGWHDGTQYLSQMVHVIQHQSETKTTRSQCMFRCCATCACRCSCRCTCCLCGLSHACPQCSCSSSCCNFDVRHFVLMRTTQFLSYIWKNFLNMVNIWDNFVSVSLFIVSATGFSKLRSEKVL